MHFAIKTTREARLDGIPRRVMPLLIVAAIRYGIVTIKRLSWFLTGDRKQHITPESIDTSLETHFALLQWRLSLRCDCKQGIALGNTDISLEVSCPLLSYTCFSVASILRVNTLAFDTPVRCQRGVDIAVTAISTLESLCLT